MKVIVNLDIAHLLLNNHRQEYKSSALERRLAQLLGTVHTEEDRAALAEERKRLEACLSEAQRFAYETERDVRYATSFPPVFSLIEKAS